MFLYIYQWDIYKASFLSYKAIWLILTKSFIILKLVWKQFNIIKHQKQFAAKQLQLVIKKSYLLVIRLHNKTYRFVIYRNTITVFHHRTDFQIVNLVKQ